MNKYTIEIETDNPRARERLYALCEDTLRGVDLDYVETPHRATIIMTEGPRAAHQPTLIGMWELDPT